MTPQPTYAELRRLLAEEGRAGLTGDEAMALCAAIAEAERLQKLFDDAGEGEYNVLALVDHYQAQAEAARMLRVSVAPLVEANAFEAEERCEWCLRNTEVEESHRHGCKLQRAINGIAEYDAAARTGTGVL